MKISNWCILFSVLFCGMILYTDLRFRYTMEAQYTMEEYNRIFDRAAEDALTDFRTYGIVAAEGRAD